MRRRVVVVPILQDATDRYLLCRMLANRGVYPGQWGLPGGGVEDGETLDEALRREVREELGLQITRAEPLIFKDTVHEKLYPDGRHENVYMIFLLFRCRASEHEVTLNDEFDACAWVEAADLSDYDLNDETRDTFHRLGVIELPAVPGGTA